MPARRNTVLDMRRKDQLAHTELAERLRTRVTEGGILDRALRVGVMVRGGGGPPVAEPYDALAHQIGQAATGVTDAQVAAVRAVAGSDKATFEVVLSAAVGAGLRRWDAAERAIEGAGDATA
jgi:hypothetical protein